MTPEQEAACAWLQAPTADAPSAAVWEDGFALMLRTVKVDVPRRDYAGLVVPLEYSDSPLDSG